MIDANLVKKLREKTGAGMLDCKKALTETNGDIDSAIDRLREKGISKAAGKADRIAAEGIAEVLIKKDEAIILELNCETDFVAKNPEFQDIINKIGNIILENRANTLESVLTLKLENQTIEDLIIAKTAKIGERISFRRFLKTKKEETQIFGKYIHMGGKIAVLTVMEGSEETTKDIAMHIAAMKPTVIKKEDLTEEEINKEKHILKEQAISEGKPAEIAEKMVEGRLQKYFKEVCLLEQQFVKDSDITVKEYLEKEGANILQFIRYEVGEGMEKRCENFADEVMNQLK